MSRVLVYLLQSRSTTVFLVLLALLVGGRALLVEMLDSRVQSDLAQLRKEGVRIDLKQFNTPPLQDESDNAAPFYESAIALCAYGVPLSNLYNSKKSTQSNVEAVLSHHATVETWVRERGAAFALLAQGYGKPQCRYQYNAEDGVNMRMINFVAMRSLCYLVTDQAILDVDSSRCPAAVTEVSHLLRLLARFQYGDSLLQQMILVSLEGNAMIPLERMAQIGVKTDYRPLLRELYLLRAQSKTSVYRGFEAERAGLVDLFAHLDNYNYLAPLFGDEHDLYWRLYKLGGRPLQLIDELQCLKFERQTQRALQEGRPLLNYEQDCGRIPAYCFITRLMQPNFRRADEQVQDLQKRLDTVLHRLEALQR